jgi:hypothetical protein
MGTNYYRIPSVQEMEQRKVKLIEDVSNLELSPSMVESRFANIEKGFDRYSAWDIFTEGTSIHLGKRSGGWKFLWNFNDKKYYSNKEELFQFIRSGRIVDEYGTEMGVEEFITMSLEWGQPDGLDGETYRRQHPRQYHYDFEKKEEYIDGLRVSSYTDFS